MMTKPLEGVKVVELGTHVAIPKVARFLAEWGAEVIKVEPPKGEPWRTVGIGYLLPIEKDNNPIWHTENMHKRSIAINMKEPEGLKIMYQLLGDADIFLTNTRMKALEKMHLDYESIKDSFPKLVYCHLSAFGNKGPEKDLPGYDISAFWAKSGLPVEWTIKGNMPFKAIPGVADSATAAVATSAVMASLFKRERTGKGEFVTTSLYSTAIWLNSCGFITGQPQYGRTYPEEHFIDPLVPPYLTKDEQWVMVCDPRWDPLYKKVFPLVGLDQYIQDERFASRQAANENYDFVCSVISDAWKNYTAAELVEKFSANGIVFARYQNPRELYCDEQGIANGYISNLELQNGSTLAVPNVPVQFSGTEQVPVQLGPELGEDTIALLRRLQYTEEQIQSFIDRQVVVAYTKD